MALFLRAHERRKDGKVHTYWSLVENRRCADGRVVQRHVLYLGALTSAQELSWEKTTEQFDAGARAGEALPGLATERELQSKEAAAMAVHLNQFRIERPRQWGACWVALTVWNLLKLSEFWASRLPASREGTRWLNVLMTLVIYRLIDPGSEWRLHRQWYEQSALGDLLGEDVGLAAKDNLYRCPDRLLEHREELFKFLQRRWQDEFGAKFDVLLYDLTSTYFESDPPFPEGDKRRFGYSRDKRPDCVQVIIALIVTPEGYPLAYETFNGNTSDKTTLKQFLENREALRQGQSGLGNGSRHTDRRGDHGNATGRSADSLPGRHAQGTFEQAGSGAGETALAAGAALGASKAPAQGKRVVRVC